MVRSGRYIGLFLTILLFVNNDHLRSQELLSDVKLNKSSVYVGEPVQVTVSVYTSTWFTRGLNLGNIKVHGAFSVYFRPVTTSFKKGGQNYAGVQLIYNIFPYSEKDILFPSLDITVETPPVGDYKGQKRVIKSSEKRIKVKPIPAGFEKEAWLVTTGMRLSDNWQGALNDVKVGDVLVRQISRVAQGTVAELIPPIVWDSIPGVSLYKTRSTVTNNKTETDISATRTETMRMLFEQEGEVAIPEMVFSWYNPMQKKLFKRTLKEVKINVQPNPDLGVLASMRDSLSVMQAEAVEVSEEEKPLRIFGLSPQRFAVVLICAVIFAYILLVFARRLLRFIKARREAYRNSEAYYFQSFKKAAIEKDTRTITQALYRWIDELQLGQPSAAYFAKKYGTKELQEEVPLIMNEIHNQPSNLNLTLNEWQKARKEYHRAKADKTKGRINGWINPA
jgi:hypothetical protein